MLLRECSCFFVYAVKGTNLGIEVGNLERITLRLAFYISLNSTLLRLLQLSCLRPIGKWTLIMLMTVCFPWGFEIALMNPRIGSYCHPKRNDTEQSQYRDEVSYVTVHACITVPRADKDCLTEFNARFDRQGLMICSTILFVRIFIQDGWPNDGPASFWHDRLIETGKVSSSSRFHIIEIQEYRQGLCNIKVQSE